MCCYQGKVKPPYLDPIPQELHKLLTLRDIKGIGFRNHICNYNQALAFTSVGRYVDNTQKLKSISFKLFML